MRFGQRGVAPERTVLPLSSRHVVTGAFTPLPPRCAQYGSSISWRSPCTPALGADTVVHSPVFTQRRALRLLDLAGVLRSRVVSGHNPRFSARTLRH